MITAGSLTTRSCVHWFVRTKFVSGKIVSRKRKQNLQDLSPVTEIYYNPGYIMFYFFDRGRGPFFTKALVPMIPILTGK